MAELYSPEYYLVGREVVKVDLAESGRVLDLLLDDGSSVRIEVVVASDGRLIITIGDSPDDLLYG